MPDAPHPLTLTHARLRRAQGDIGGAIEILETLIDAGQEDQELVQLYLALGGDEQRTHREPTLPTPDAPVAADLDELSEQFRSALGRGTGAGRIQRLERWLSRVQRGRAPRGS